jgi:hypothetical protein
LRSEIVREIILLQPKENSMKLISICLVLFIAQTGLAKSMKFKGNADRKPSSVGDTADFSAFTKGNLLYVTIIGDTCNQKSGSLKVTPFCDKNRSTRNAAPICEAELTVVSTMMGCEEVADRPQVLPAIDLAKTNLDPNSKVLKLLYGKQVIRVGINK